MCIPSGGVGFLQQTTPTPPYLHHCSEIQATPQDPRGIVTRVSPFAHGQKHPELERDDFCEGSEMLEAVNLIC